MPVGLPRKKPPRMKGKKKSVRRPKKRRSPYVYFIKEYQNYLKKKNNRLSFVECSKLCAAKWKHMSDCRKEKYRKMSAKDGIRYRKQMKALSPEQLRKTKRKRDPMAPLRPLSAYLWFCKKNWTIVSNKNPNKSTSEIIKCLAKLWSQSTEKTRKKFEEYAECDRKCYQVEMEKYRKRRKNR